MEGTPSNPAASSNGPSNSSTTGPTHIQSEDAPAEQKIWSFIFTGGELEGKSYSGNHSESLKEYIISPEGIQGNEPKKHQKGGPRSPSYASFGNAGTTASVNSHGQLMQITRFLGAGRSGFLCADSWSTSEPYFVQRRAEELIRMSTDHGSGTGFYFQKFKSPTLDFIGDRWPRYTMTRDDIRLQMQYFAYDGSIVQQFLVEKLPQDSSLDMFTIDSDIMIRELEWQEDRHLFNEATFRDDKSYMTALSNEDFSLIRTHHDYSGYLKQDSSSGEQHSNDPRSEVCSGRSFELAIVAFVNGRPSKLRKTVNGPNFEYCVAVENAETKINEEKRLEIVIVYRLQFAETNDSSIRTSSLTNASILKAMRTAFKPTKDFTQIKFSSNNNFDFTIRRNLEHILSVCCIPILPKSTTSQSSVVSQEQDGKPDVAGEKEGGSETLQEQYLESPIAITCGDMSGHRLVNSANFAAFQFLVSICRFLIDTKSSTNDSQGNSKECRALACRIHSICTRHIQWVLKHEDPDLEDNFAPEYWASGKRISSMEERQIGSSSCLTDIAFRVVKVAALRSPDELGQDQKPKEDWEQRDDQKQKDHQNYEENQSKKQDNEVIRWITSWRTQLQKAERRPERGPYAFARSTDGITQSDVYFLEDHVWIWKALQCIESHWPNEIRKPKEGNRKGNNENQGTLAPRQYTSKEAQRNILKRFTTENPALKRRMIAVFRSSSETRFMFRLRDTALLHCMELKFFNMADSNNIADVWRSTLLSQISHEENQTNRWDNALRYSSALALASKGYHINQSTIGEITEESRRVLLGPPSANGLFPGYLNHATKDPEIFQYETHCDDYWYASFEIPHTLWKHARKALEKRQGRQERQKNPDGSVPNKMFQETNSKLTEAEKELISTRSVAITNKYLPFNNLIDQKSIFEPQDEWLYPAPGFLADFSPVKEEDETKKVVSEQDHLSSPEEFQGHDSGDAVARRGVSEAKRLSSHRESQQHLLATFVDVHRSSGSSKEGKSDPLEKPYEIGNFQKTPYGRKLSEPYEESESGDVKKRLIWVRVDDKEVSKNDWTSTSEHGKDDIKAFLERHKAYDNYFYDDTTAALNTWKTELHLAFYRYREPADNPSSPGTVISDRTDDYSHDGAPGQGQVGQRTDTFKPTDHISNDGTHQQGQGVSEVDRLRGISRATMGFRIDGDFFDRYWICHFVESDPKSGIKTGPTTKDFKRLLRPHPLPEKDKHSWKQRKVLELLLFGEILDEIRESTQTIMNHIRSQLSQLREETLHGSGRSSEKNVEKEHSKLGVQQPKNRGSSGSRLRVDEESQPMKSPEDSSSSVSFDIASSLQSKDALDYALKAADFISKLKSQDYLAFSQQPQEFEQILRVLYDDLGENIEQIERWKNRENDRGTEKPRWTKNDERRYRTAITKMLASNSQKMRDLYRCRSNVQSLRASLESTRVYIRDDINLRNAQDVRIFTYVTATFLPISFATGLFSMNGFPGGAVLGSMIGLAVIFVLLTSIAVIYDKKLALYASTYKTGFRKAARWFSGSQKNASQSTKEPSTPQKKGSDLV